MITIENTPNSERHQTCLDGRVVRGEGIANTLECFVQLWLKLERTRRLLASQCKRFCIRNILRSWFGLKATDDYIFEVCMRGSTEELTLNGMDTLPPPAISPRKHRELLRAIVSITLGIGTRKVHLSQLDKAFCQAFPRSTAINVNKKKKPP